MSGDMKTMASKHFTVSTFNLFLLIVIIFSFLTACSSIKTNTQPVSYSDVTHNNSYQVRVRSGNVSLDKIIYEAATKKFGKYLPVSGQEPITGTIDITFISTAKRGITGSSPGYKNNVVYGNKWYTGETSISKGSGFSSSESGSSPIGMFYLQKSNMRVLINKRNGVTFWRAQDAYNGVTDFSRLFVQTAGETAIFSLDRLVNQFKHDFFISGTLSESKFDIKPPDAALVIKNKKPVTPRIPAGRIKIKQDNNYLEF